jgi:peptide/nickel transport system permease protein
MLRFIIRRLLISIPLLLIASVLVFTVIHLTTDPTAGLRVNPRISAADMQRYRHDLGLDRSGPAQYFAWLGNFVRGNWGTSLFSNIPVSSQIREALVNSMVLGITGWALALLLGVGIGVIAAIRQYSSFDYLATSGAFLALSIPTFWFALIMQLLFGVYLVRWLHLSEPPLFTAGMSLPGSVGFDPVDRLRHLALPAIVLAVQLIAVYSRYMRASMLEVMGSDFLRTARAKGVRERRVIVNHGMRNALIPLTTQAAIDFGALAAGLIATEAIFQWPGMGFLFVRVMNDGDYAIALPWVMLTMVFVIVFNLVADILYAVLDPRIRYA